MERERDRWERKPVNGGLPNWLPLWGLELHSAGEPGGQYSLRVTSDEDQ